MKVIGGSTPILLALAILPGEAHFPANKPIPWEVRGCEGKVEATLQKWQGDWLSGNGLWLSPPEWEGSLEKLAKTALKPGAYRLTARAGDCSTQKEFTVAPFYAVVRWDEKRLVLSAYRFEDHRPVQGLKFSILDGNEVVSLGWTGPSDFFVLGMPERGSEIRFLGPSGEPAKLLWARAQRTEGTRGLRVFAARHENDLRLLFISLVSRIVLLKNSVGDVVWRLEVIPPFHPFNLTDFKDASIWIVEESPEPGKSHRVTARNPPYMWMPEPTGIPSISATERLRGESLTIGWETATGDKTSISFLAREDRTTAKLDFPSKFLETLDSLKKLWVDGREGRIYYRWEEEPEEAAEDWSTAGPSSHGFLFSPDFVKPIEVVEPAEGPGKVAPPGIQMLKETLLDGILWVDETFVPAAALERRNDPRFLDPLVGGSCVRLQVADIGPVAALITDPEFSPESLVDIHAIGVASTQPVSRGRFPRFLKSSGPPTIFSIVDGIGPGNLKLCLPASPGVYRLTTLARRGGDLFPRSFTFTIEDGIGFRGEVTEIPDTAFSYRLSARIVNASLKAKEVIIRTDLPIGLTLRPGEVKAYQREFWGRSGDQIIAILKEPEALLMDKLLQTESEWNETLPGVATWVLLAKTESSLAGALANLYEYAVENGFSAERGMESPDLEMTGVAYLAMKVAIARGAPVDPRRYDLAEKWLKENLKDLPDWLNPEGNASILPEAKAIPEMCAVFPEDILLWRGEKGDDGCPARSLSFTASVERNGSSTRLRVESKYPSFTSDSLLVFVETGHCESPTWTLRGSPAMGVASPQSLRIYIKSGGGNRAEINFSCARGVVGEIRVWAPLEGGIKL